MAVSLDTALGTRRQLQPAGQGPFVIAEMRRCCYAGMMPTSTRAAALAMVHKLHWERVRAGRRRIQWVSIDAIVERHEDVDALAYAVEHGWIAVEPGRQSVTLTDAGSRLATAKG
jgi:hypothetical protein